MNYKIIIYLKDGTNYTTYSEEYSGLKAVIEAVSKREDFSHARAEYPSGKLILETK